VADGTVAQDTAQAGAIWALRESISEGLRHRGASVSPPNSFLPFELVCHAHPCIGSGGSTGSLILETIQAFLRGPDAGASSSMHARSEHR